MQSVTFHDSLSKSTLGAQGETVALLDGGARAYPRMLHAIEHARRTIHLEVYAFALSTIGSQFVDALSLAAQRGVQIVVLIDGWGSARGGRSIAAILRAAGCHVRIHNRLLALLLGRFARNHRKILLVDDEVAFLGGINIGDENLRQGKNPGWADLALEIRGPQSLSLGYTVRKEPYAEVRSSLRIYLCGLGGGRRLRRRYLNAFACAQKTIHIAHGYFLPDRSVIRALTKAVRRGVQVHLLVAGQSDVPFARAASRSLYRHLLAHGISIHEWQDSILHAKVATVDGCRLLVGSFNLDPFSLANLESLVEVADPELVRQGEAWIEKRFAQAHAVTVVETNTLFHRWFEEPIGRVVARAAETISRVLARA